MVVLDESNKNRKMRGTYKSRHFMVGFDTTQVSSSSELPTKVGISLLS